MENHCIDCGKKISKNAIRCRRCANKGKNNPRYGKHFTPKMKQKSSKSHKGQWTLQWFINKYGLELGSLYYQNRCNTIGKIHLGKCNSEKVKQEISMNKIEYYKIYDVWNKGLTKETDERLKKSSEGTKRAWQRGDFDNISTPERNKKISETLKQTWQNGIYDNRKPIKNPSLISQKYFWEIYNSLSPKIGQDCYFAELNDEYKIGHYNVDFCIPSENLIIEFYGDYFHANPEFYKATDFFKRWNMMAKEI